MNKSHQIMLRRTWNWLLLSAIAVLPILAVPQSSVADGQVQLESKPQAFGWKQASQETITALESLDYSSMLESVEVQDIDANGRGTLRLPFTALTTTAEELTPGEKAHAYGYRVSETHWQSSDLIAGCLTNYYSVYGSFPASGAELAVWCNQKLVSEEYVAGLGDLTVQEQIEAVNCMVNPITGKVFDTFEDDTWRPGEVYIRRISDEEFTTRSPRTAERFRSYGEPLPTAFFICFFGEEPNHILVLDDFSYMVSDNSSFMSDPEVLHGDQTV